MKKKLQVFVSGTFLDLKAERQAAVEAILKAGHIPAGMELFTAGDRSQMTTIQNWINESDVYMLILGGRYGSLEPSTKLSYTELEYDYATTQGKRVFATVISDEALEAKIKAHGSGCIEKDNPQLLKQFRSKVLQKMSTFFLDTKDIKLCIHETLADFKTDGSLRGWISGFDVPDVKSLQDEIAQLRDENANLRRALEAAGTRRGDNTEVDEDEELKKTLEAIEVAIPAKLAKTKEDVKASLLDIAYAGRDRLITGITNSYDMGDINQFYFYNVLPKLQAHGLADNEKVPGSALRRAFLNKKGCALFCVH